MEDKGLMMKDHLFIHILTDDMEQLLLSMNLLVPIEVCSDLQLNFNVALSYGGDKGFELEFRELMDKFVKSLADHWELENFSYLSRRHVVEMLPRELVSFLYLP
jgi:hypothetical protein